MTVEFTISGQDSLDDLRSTVNHWRNNQGSIEPKPVLQQHPNLAQDFTYPIRGYTVQDISFGEWGLVKEVVRAHSANSFKVDLFGLWNLTTINFTLELTMNGVVQFTTGPINGSGTTTAVDVKNAILSASLLGNDDVVVDLGNPYVSPNILPSAHNNYTSPGQSITGSWHISFPVYQTQILELKATNVSGQVIHDSSMVVSRRTFEQTTGREIWAFDAYDLALPAPIRAGSKVVCLPFIEGYGIVGANQVDFHVGAGT